MSATGNMTGASDELARETIRTELDTTMLVEAGAGSGKTTLMVDRLLAYIARGTTVDELAAVTFTRKAANELRQRLEGKMEERSRSNTGDVQDRFIAALRNRERMFIGTVHAFCGRILREHALEAGLPPDFTELDEAETTTLREASWRTFVEHASRDDNPLLARVLALGIEPLALFGAFADREQYRDVEFPAPLTSCPPHNHVRDSLLALIRTGKQMRSLATSGERDALQKTLDRLQRNHELHDEWNTPNSFASDAIALLSASGRKLVQKHWGDTKEAKSQAKDFSALVDEYVDTQLKPWLAQWWAHAYAPVVALLNAGSEWAAAQRRRLGQLGFDDLLTETARLLRSRPHARATIGERWRYLLVDEFQDTDPVQAEVCFLIASDPAEGDNWRAVRLREGSLFVVGDPKQSIYRFRRADLSMYRLVEARIAECGKVLHLTRNFRSVPEVGALVNEYFSNVFVAPGDASPHSVWQAPFAEFVAASIKAPHAQAGIARYQIGQSGDAKNSVLIAEDAALLASWIARRCGAGGDRRPQDFLILTPRKGELAAYAHELALRNIPVSVSGAVSSVDDVLQELLIILRALADPGNAVAVIAALEGWCVGCSHADLWYAHENRLEFRITHAPGESESPAGAGLQQLYRWWIASQRLSAASLLERVLDDSGLLVLAASTDLGDRSAGQLLQLIALLQGNIRTDLVAAIEAIERSLNEDDEAPTLRVARSDAVRLMNLHKAKGLESPVVILAAPVPHNVREPRVATWREHGEAYGAFRVVGDNKQTLAQPTNWQELSQQEATRSAAEVARLLYVAVTRAEEELIVSQRAPYTLAKGDVRVDASRWAPLAPTLLRHARELQLVADEPPGRREVQTPASQFRDEIRGAQTRLQRAQQSRYSLVSVTEAAKRNETDAQDDGSSMEREIAEGEMMEFRSLHGVDAREFGSLVHAALEGALRGRNDNQLPRYVRALVFHALGKHDENNRERVANSVLHAVAEARRSSAWIELTSGRGALAELNVSQLSSAAGQTVLLEGVVDAVSETGDGWLVVDWKINRSSDAQWERQLPAYKAQAEAYASTIASRTRSPGRVRIERLQGKP